MTLVYSAGPPVWLPANAVPGEGDAGRKAAWLFAVSSAGMAIPETVILPAPSHNDQDEWASWLHGLDSVIEQFEQRSGCALGSCDDPLLLAARVSLRGVQEATSLLNVGLPDAGPVKFRGVPASSTRVDEARRRLAQTLNVPVQGGRAAAIARIRSFAREHLLPSTARTSGARALSSVGSLVIQRMRPSMLIPGTCRIVFVSRDPDGPASGPVGYSLEVDDGGQLQYRSLAELEPDWPAVYTRISAASRVLECTFGAVCRVQFGVDADGIFVLSVHQASVTPEVGCDLLTAQVADGIRTPREALEFVDSQHLRTSGTRQIRNQSALSPLARGSSLGEWRVSGRLALDARAVDAMLTDEQAVIYVSEELKLEDTATVSKAAGVVSARGGITSHMSVVARGMGKACIAGVERLSRLGERRAIVFGGRVVEEGSWITLDEREGIIYLGRADFAAESRPEAVERVLAWANEERRVQVLVNADSPSELRQGLLSGADGVGLCRSEHQLLEGPVLDAYREVLLARRSSVQLAAVATVMTALADRLRAMLHLLGGRPIHYRLLDAPANEFLPGEATEWAPLAERLGEDEAEIRSRASQLREQNALLGCRGCRWGTVFEDFYRAQIRMVVRTADEVAASGTPVALTLVIPMVVSPGELSYWADICRQEQGALEGERSAPLDVTVGVMVETPRAALLGPDLAADVSTFCVGTNDLTQAVWAMSRDDAGQYLPRYRQLGLVDIDPFRGLDVRGVGHMIRNLVDDVHKTRPEARFYVCGEHGGQPDAVKWFATNGIDGVSCTPERVGGAIVAAAQAAITASGSNGPRVPLASFNHCQERAHELMDRIVSEMGKGDRQSAQRAAYEWAASTSARLGLDETDVWKFFKRNLAIQWFGPREYRRFAPGWDTEDALAYAWSLRQHRVRYSLFPYDIACHAVSRALPAGGPQLAWRDHIDGLDHGVPMEIFPQQPESKLAFRGMVDGFAIRIEAGFGQAMYVFEVERGSHQVIAGSMDSRDGAIRFVPMERTAPSIATAGPLADVVGALLQRHGRDTWARCRDLCETLGLDWVAIEGYYDAATGDAPFVCDVDIPPDVAFYDA